MVVLLENLNLSKLSDIFEKNEVTMEDLETFNDEDLDRIGVRKYASRRRILDAVKGITSKEDDSQPSASHSPASKHQDKQSQQRKMRGYLEDQEILLLTSSGPAAEYYGKYLQFAIL